MTLTVVSQAATLTVRSPLVFTEVPFTHFVTLGQPVHLTVSVDGDGPLRYQWAFNGTLIPGMTESTLSISNFSTVNAGHYSVAATDVYGITSTSSADLSSFSTELRPVLTIAGTTGELYRIEYSDTLAGTDWLVFTNLTLQGSPHVIVDTDPLRPAQRFYRAKMP